MTSKGWWILVAGVGLATILCLFFWRLSLQSSVVKQPMDSAPVESLVEEARRELNRLANRYQFYLDDLLSVFETLDEEPALEAILGTVAVTRVSQTVLPDSFGRSRTLAIDSAACLPTFDRAISLANPNSFWIDPKGSLMQSYIRSGWQKVSDSEVVYWRKTGRADCLLIATVDVDKLHETISEWLVSERSGVNFSKIEKVAGGAVQLLDPSGEVIWAQGDWLATEADFVESLATPFGAWTMQSHRPFTTEVRVRKERLVPGLLLAFLVGSLGAVLAFTFSRAERESRQRVSFVNQASHELRTPITNILLNNELAAEMLFDAPEDSLERIELVNEEAGRLSRLVDNLLTFSRGDAGNSNPPKWAKISPDAIVEKTLEVFRSSFDREGICIETSLACDAQIIGDPDALTQILNNLFSNVEKYAKKGSYMSVCSMVDGDQLSISIEDRGPGIPLLYQDRIFEPFFRRDNKLTEGVSGTGLGLSISRDLAREMGGDLCCQSDQGGSTFILTIPIAS